MIIDREYILKVMAKNNTVVISFSIAMFLLLILLLLVTYNSKCQMDNVESFYNDNMQTSPEYNNSVAMESNKDIDVNKAASGIGNYQASDPLGNEVYNPVQQQTQPVQTSQSVQQRSQSVEEVSDTETCFAKDRLTSADLLPKDANSKWAQLNPAGAGEVTDQNYLTAGYHIGINTVGQSLRNANLQLRYEIPNPQIAVSPWLISTIEPDQRSHGLMDIGSAPMY